VPHVSPKENMSRYLTESGPHTGIGGPAAVLILTRNDGKTYRLAGDRIGLSAKFGPPPDAGHHWFVTDGLHIRGRFVRLAVQYGLLVFRD